MEKSQSPHAKGFLKLALLLYLRGGAFRKFRSLARRARPGIFSENTAQDKLYGRQDRSHTQVPTPIDVCVQGASAADGCRGMHSSGGACRRQLAARRLVPKIGFLGSVLGGEGPLLPVRQGQEESQQRQRAAVRAVRGAGGRSCVRPEPHAARRARPHVAVACVLRGERGEVL